MIPPENPGDDDNPIPPERPRNATERFLSELFQQAASMDMAPAHDAPLAKQLRRKRRSKKASSPPEESLSLETILAWADAHQLREGRWPTQHSGPVFEAPHEDWRRIDAALRNGNRGLSRGSSLSLLLAERRGVRNIHTLPQLTEEQILAWADAYRKRHGRWPPSSTTPIDDAPGETWNAVDLALNRGRRGLPGGSSLPQLLAERRGYRNPSALPPYTVQRVLAWADAHHTRHGTWPKVGDGPIEEAPGETWMAVNQALDRGRRGFPGGSSLAKLLEKHRGVRNVGSPPPLTEEKILSWADAYFAEHRTWPSDSCGPIPGTIGETWATVDNALIQGGRGRLPGGDSLAKLFKRCRNKSSRRRIHRRPALTEEMILAWADSWHQRFGKWPHCGHREPLPEAPGENWLALNAALNFGYRGLPGGESLSQFLHRHGRR